MGTKLQCESYLPGYLSMRDLNEDSSSCGWPLYYGDKVFGNGQYYNGYLPRTISDTCSGYDKDIVKRTMLEHEAIFKDQVYELHRLYRIQRDMMTEAKRKELHAKQIAVDASLSSSALASQITSDNVRKWHISGFPFVNAASDRPSTSYVEKIDSPFSSLKGSSSQASPLPSQNGNTSKHMEMLESRPTKVRRKMFDLQLPAEEYIFTEDGEEGQQAGDGNFSGTSSCLPNGNHKITSENGRNLLLSNGMKSNHCHGDSKQSESCLRSRPNVADLNEPIEIDDTDTPEYVDLVVHGSSHREIQGHERAPKLKGEPLGLSEKVSTNICRSNDIGGLSNQHLPNNENGSQWFSKMLDRGHGKANLVSVGPHAEKLSTSSQSVQTLLNTFRGRPSHFPSDQSSIDHMREKSGLVLQVSETYQGPSNGCRRESSATSRTPGPHPISSSDLVKSWSNSVSSWEKPNSRSMSAQLHPYMNPSTSMSRNSQAPALGHSIFGDRWNCNSTSMGNSSFGRELLTRNGYYNGSSSGSRDPVVHLSPIDYDHLNSRSASHAALERFTDQSPAKSCRSIVHTNEGSANDVNLNAVFSSIASDKLNHQRNPEVINVERKDEDNNLAALPWLRTKRPPKNEAIDARLDLNAGKMSFLQSFSRQSGRFESDRDAGSPNVKSVSCFNVVEPNKPEASDSSCRKILGFPIYDVQHIFKREASSVTSHSLSLPQPSVEVDNSRKHMMFDMNLPCDAVVSDIGQQTAAELVSVKETDAKRSNFRHQIDLNACMSEEEASLIPSFAESNAKVRGVIDLEAPVVPETDDDAIPGEECLATVQALVLQLPPGEAAEDEHIRIAAEAIVAISLSVDSNCLEETTISSPKASMTDSLMWFAEIICSSKEDLESKGKAALRAKVGENNDKLFAQGLDYFESMTLKLTETKEEDYMPKPLVPENLQFDETVATPVPTRARKGQARRGRQRRDFQRDILPGLVSLSRHEVTEDIQTIGGLMRATGHSWHAGLTRRNSTRNGSARGRRRTLITPSPPVVLSPPCTPLIQQLSNIEEGLDDRSLTGWGKTTRRPRRQRCPAGNPLPIPLT